MDTSRPPPNGRTPAPHANPVRGFFHLHCLTDLKHERTAFLPNSSNFTSSACNADGIGFGYSLDDFADLVTAEQMASWNAAVNDAAGAAEGADGGANPSR